MTAHDDPNDRAAGLAADLARLARNRPDELTRLVAGMSVREQAELALRIPAAQRPALLLHAPRPMRLVRALPDADLYLTVREVGPTDAMPVLALASARQLLHLIDLEAWRRDRFDADRAGAWIAVLLEAGEPALRRFLRSADDELLALLFARWIGVEQIEYEDSAEKHGHGEGEAGTELGTMTPDGYHRFSPSIAEHAPAIRRVLQLFYVEQPERYQRIVWASRWEMGSELEEQALHWRQSRLEEHGFPSWEEALAVYAGPDGIATHPEPPAAADPDGLEASRGFLMVLPPENALIPAIDSLNGKARERVLFEMLAVANRLLVADASDTGDPLAHREAIHKAAGGILVALGARGAERADAAAAVLTAVPTLELFREGWARISELQARARAIGRSGWAAGRPRALELLDSPVRERVQALLETRPRYLAGETVDGPAAPREFRSPAEVEETRVAVEMAEVLGRLMVERLGLDLAGVLAAVPPGEEPPRFSALWNSLLAWHATRAELRGDPLPEDVVADFLRTVASRRTADPEAPGRALGSLLAELVSTAGLSAREGAVLEGFGRYALERLAEECGGLDPGVPLDPRTVGCLLVQRRG